MLRRPTAFPAAYREQIMALAEVRRSWRESSIRLY